MLTTKTKYGLRALMELARLQPRNELTTAASIARQQKIPLKFLEAILLELKNHGVVTSKRGPDGGYSLTEDPAKIRLGRIVRMLDGPLAPTPCVSQEHYQKCDDCVDESTCALRGVMKDVRNAIAQVLDGTTLRDLSDQADELAEAGSAPMYYI
ncbi:MAG: hypothetical protein AMXMBFR84_23410 [Candidatus Hydrogenedentota bacterium]